VFVSMRDHTWLIPADEDTARWAGELYVMRDDGARQHRITTTPRLDESAPRWSPGGTRVGYARRGYPFGTRLFQSNGDGTCPTAISRGKADTWYALLTWLPSKGSGERPLGCP
jgi:hypothetical protein